LGIHEWEQELLLLLLLGVLQARGYLTEQNPRLLDSAPSRVNS
jgi:hypothetical protein